jgi:hypothetical protein
LRPLKFLYLIPGLREITDALIKSVWGIMNVIFVMVMVWLIFAIFGITLYSGRMGYCEHRMAFHVSQAACIREGRVWETFPHNFENIIEALPTLFILATLDVWGDVL